MAENKLILVSMDALLFEDLEYLSQKPAFGYLLQHCALVERVRSIYPTLTYPCHASMATGCYPIRHGVVNNTAFGPGESKLPWNWMHDVYQLQDIVDAAKAAGLSTACVGWPSMGRHPSADYLVGEIAGTSAKTEADYHRDYRFTGTPQWLWETVCQPNIHWRTEQKRVGVFNAMVCKDMIRRYAPDLVLLHLANPDSARHKNGVFSEKNHDALDECELILTALLEGIRESGAAEQYNLVVTADHGQLDQDRIAKPNVLFAKHGFLTIDDAGFVTHWRAWNHTVGMSSTVYVQDPTDEPAVYALLKSYVGQGFSRVYTREEAAAEGYGGSFSFVLETDGHTGFQDSFQGEYLVPKVPAGGSHGFHPDKGPRPPMVCMGPAFRTGTVLPGANLVDGAPTWAKVLGVDLPDTDGTVLTALLRP